MKLHERYDRGWVGDLPDLIYPPTRLLFRGDIYIHLRNERGVQVYIREKDEKPHVVADNQLDHAP